MTNFILPQRYEFPLGKQLAGIHDGIVIIAEYAFGQQTVGPYLTFRAEFRGMVFEGVGVAYSSDKIGIDGAEFRKRISGGPTFYERDLLDNDPVNWHLGSTIRWVANGDLVGRAASDATWTIFYRLVLSDPEWESWIESLDNEWLIDLANEIKTKAAS